MSIENTQMASNTQLANSHKMDFPLIIFLLNCLLAHSFIHSMQLGSQLHAIAAAKQQTNIFAQFYQSCLCERVKKCSFYNFHPLFCPHTLSSLCSPSITLSLCVFLRRAWYSITTLSFICMRKHPLCRHKRRPRHSPSSPTYTHSTHPSSTLPSRTKCIEST